MLNTLKTDSSSSAGTEAIGTTPSPVNQSELETNYTVLMKSFKMLKMAINTLIASVTNETTTEINERKGSLDSLPHKLKSRLFQQSPSVTPHCAYVPPR